MMNPPVILVVLAVIALILLLLLIRFYLKKNRKDLQKLESELNEPDENERL
jgi:hypothetical protein